MSEAAWAAGLFDGEGTIFASEHTRSDGRDHVRLHMALGMTTEETVRRFAAVVAVGNVVELFNQPGNRKPQWRWQATADGDVRMAFAAIERWLSGPKREQAAHAFTVRDEFMARPRELAPHQKPQRSCKRGHDQSVHRYVAPGGGRYCRACQREGARAKRDDAPLLNGHTEAA